MKMVTTLLAAAVLALAAGCGRLNRATTLNQVTQTSGAGTEQTLEQALRTQGHPTAHVTCAKSMIVNVGTRTSCQLSGVAGQSTVSFTYAHGGATVSSVSVQP